MKIIYGGAFDPVHNEHVNMIKYLLSLDIADKVIVLPSANPPHKNCGTLFSQRVDMLDIALDGLDDVEICDIESKDTCKHYTCEVLPKLKAKYKEISFVIGGDSLEQLNNWKNPQDIVKICPLIVFKRGKSDRFDEALKYWRGKGAEIFVCDYEPDDVSSTLVRYFAELGDFEKVDDKVADYIKAQGLYSKYKDRIRKLENNIPACTFEHCSRTAKCALQLNYKLKLGLDYDKVLLAGLFHDCAKWLCKAPHSTVGVPTDAIDTPVEHQFMGAIIAREEYGVDDIDVLQAIKYHTTGKRHMNTLQKLIFCADMLELGRNYPEVCYLRDCINKSLDLGYRECVLAQYRFLEQKGGNIYPLTLEAVQDVRLNNVQ